MVVIGQSGGGEGMACGVWFEEEDVGGLNVWMDLMLVLNMIEKPLTVRLTVMDVSLRFLVVEFWVVLHGMTCRCEITEQQPQERFGGTPESWAAPRWVDSETGRGVSFCS